MAKIITISFSNYVFDRYLATKIENRSKFIEEMFTRGCDNACSEEPDWKNKFLNNQTELYNKARLIEEQEKIILKLRERVEALNKKHKEVEPPKYYCLSCGKSMNRKIQDIFAYKLSNCANCGKITNVFGEDNWLSVEAEVPNLSENRCKTDDGEEVSNAPFEH